MRKKWIDSYKLLLDYYNTHGNVDIPTNYVVDGIDLHIWLANQVQAYRCNGKNRLTAEQIKLLDDLGALERKRRNWEQMYKLFEDYYNEHGSLDNIEDEELKIIARDQRVLYSSGKLQPERIAQLEKLNFPFSIQEMLWKENYNILKKYYDEHGNTDIKYDAEIDGKKIGAWLFNEKREMVNYLNSERKKYRIKLLENIGVESATNKWDAQYEILKKYYKKHGNCRIPRDYTVDGYDIYFWCVTQRRRLLDNDNLTEEEKQRIIKLNKINFVWYPSDRKIFKSEIDDTNKDKFNLALLKEMKTVLTGLELEKKNKINKATDQEKLEKLIIKRLFK